MGATADELRCVYCLQFIDKDDDAQRIDKRQYAHTACAFAADQAFWAALDTESETDDVG